MAESPAQPSNPPRGTSPAKSVDKAAGTSWDNWHKHGNQDPAAALADKPQKNPIDPGCLK